MVRTNLESVYFFHRSRTSHANVFQDAPDWEPEGMKVSCLFGGKPLDTAGTNLVDDSTGGSTRPEDGFQLIVGNEDGLRAGGVGCHLIFIKHDQQALWGE
jgi:hypothetical protein